MFDGGVEIRTLKFIFWIQGIVSKQDKTGNKDSACNTEVQVQYYISQLKLL